MNKRNFWNDGISIQDFEKLLLGFLLFISVGIGAYKYFQVGDISTNWTNVIFILGGLFTVRKAFSYFRGSNYNQSLTPEDNRGNQESGGI